MIRVFTLLVASTLTLRVGLATVILAVGTRDGLMVCGASAAGPGVQNR